MNIKRTTQIAVALSSMAFLYGCPPAQQPTLPVITEPAETDVNAGVVKREADSEMLITQLAVSAQQLPAATEADQRKLLVDCFSDIGSALPLLRGPGATGAFRQEVTLVDRAKTQLQSIGADVSSDAAVSSGLRATLNALIAIDVEQYPDVPEIAKPIDALSKRCDELDINHTAMVKQIEAEAMRNIADAMEQMHKAMKQRMGTPVAKPKPTPPPPQPSFVAPKPPASKPATRSVTVPAPPDAAGF